MESVAPPGGVMLSDSTASLVEHIAVLADPEWVRIKGSDDPVRARRLVAAGRRDGPVGRAEASLVGRHWEMAAIDAIVDRAIGGHGGVVNIVGPPGIGKSRVAGRPRRPLPVAESMSIGPSANPTPATFPSKWWRGCCAQVPASLNSTTNAARARCATKFPMPTRRICCCSMICSASPTPRCRSPQIDPDARRRRLTALINTTAIARTEPTLFVIEDAHWIDAVSESMIADFLAVVPRTASMVLITSRPEYGGVLTRVTVRRR